MNYLTTAQTAEYLGISKASVRNWVRHGYLNRGNAGFSRDEVMGLLEKIRSGEIGRLNRRANKRMAGGVIVPEGDLRAISAAAADTDLGNDSLMFLISLKILIGAGLIEKKEFNIMVRFNEADYSGMMIRKHMRRWYGLIEPDEKKRLPSTWESLLKYEIPRFNPAGMDSAGIIYQAIRQRGARSGSGSFYTPAEVSSRMVRSAAGALSPGDIRGMRFLDPCCGTGQFLMSFISAGGSPERAFGMDSDRTAVMTAVTNILLLRPDMKALPPVFCADSLTEIPEYRDSDNDTSQNKFPGVFDLIVTNPPWGGRRKIPDKRLNTLYPRIRSGESFSLFICRSLELTKSGGIASFVLPESITNVDRHSDIRRYIGENTEILQVEKLGRIFKGVYTPVITIELRKPGQKPVTLPTGSSYENRTVTIRDKGKEHSLPLKDFLFGPEKEFNINLNSRDICLIDKIHNTPHITLAGRADWALGIVTGDNNRFLRDNAAEGFEPVIRGSDILTDSYEKGRIKPPCTYIKFSPEDFQQAAPEWKYRKPEKIVYRFIADRPVLAVDTEGRLTLNSANCLIPGIEGLSNAALAFLFNSDIYGFIYRKMFGSVKVLRGHLEQLPIPESVINEKQFLPEVQLPLQEILGLDSDDIDHIANSRF